VSGIVHRVGGDERHAMGASAVVIKATGEDTGGAFFVAEVLLEAGFPGPPRHFHRRLHETVYVLEGELTMTLGDKVAVLTPGDFASIPPGVVHTFRNNSAQPARALNLNAPAGWEHYLRELAAAASAGGLTPALMGESASRHDFQLACAAAAGFTAAPCASKVPDFRYSWTCSRRPAKAPGYPDSGQLASLPFDEASSLRRLASTVAR